MIGMGSNLVAGIFLAILMVGVAFAAGCALLIGIWLWRKKRIFALILILPSTLYLAFFLYIFVPRPLPQYVVHLDLRHPTDLSGIPSSTKWLSASWPQPAKIVPLASGSFCCIEGKVEISIVLPDGQLIHDNLRNVFIHTDEAGIWQVDMNVYSVDPKTALSKIKPYLWPLVASSFEQTQGTSELTNIEAALNSYVPKSPLARGFRLSFPHYLVDFGLKPTFIPSSNVCYFCMITLPHFEGIQQFTSLPPVVDSKALINEARPLIPSFYATAEKVIPSQEWPDAIARLNPTEVYAHETTLFMVFDRHQGVGSHCLAVSKSDRLVDSGRVDVMSIITPGLYEVRYHY